MSYRKHTYEVFCDSLQEGLWFRQLHDDFKDAELMVIPSTLKEQMKYGIEQVLQYDRPDITSKTDPDSGCINHGKKSGIESVIFGLIE